MVVTTTPVATDERDAQIVAARAETYDAIRGPRVGDYISFRNGAGPTRRISHVWPADCYEDGIARLQTSDLPGGDEPWHSGTYYLGNGYVSYSGGLHGSVKADTLTEAGNGDSYGTPGTIWIFHHDLRGAGRGVTRSMLFRAFTCSEEAPR